MTDKKEPAKPAYKDISGVLHFIQKTLKAPKNQKNAHGNYMYRSCEDIVEAVKLIMPDGCTLKINDEIVMIGARFYVKATATICFAGGCESSTAYAREPEEQKGMQAAQLTGATSSYARKYALNALFLIDDTKDADATNDHGKAEPEKQPKKSPPKQDTKPAAKNLTAEQIANKEFLEKCLRELKAIQDYEAVIKWQNLEETKAGIKKLSLEQVNWLNDKINLTIDRLNPINAG